MDKNLLDKFQFGELYSKKYVGAAIGRPHSEALRIRIGSRRIRTGCRRTSNARPYNVNLRLFNKFQSLQQKTSCKKAVQTKMVCTAHYLLTASAWR